MLTKAQAGYMVNPGPGGCGACRYSHRAHCDVVNGNVLPFACCNWWNKPDAPSITKTQAGYVIGAGYGDPILCSSCRFFEPQGACTIVEGPIKPEDSCERWLAIDR